MIERLLWCAVACLWCTLHVSVHVSARSTVSITSPAVLSTDPLFNNIDHRPAVFGNPPYGSYLSGVLWYPQNEDSEWGCNKITKESDYPTNAGSSGPPVFVMLDRSQSTAPVTGKCTFVTKVRNAAAIGAAAVVIINYDDVSMPYMADDGTGEDLTINAVLIKHSVGEALTAAMRPTTSAFVSITMQIGWQLPSVNGSVSWQLWTAAYDPKSSSLKSEFGPADAKLHNQTSFEPKYYFIRGSDMAEQCNVNTTQKPTCRLSCLQQGQYCVKDPDADGILTGADVARENVLQMCLWKQLATLAGNDPTVSAHMTKNKWWSYVSTSDEECDPPADVLEDDACRQGILADLQLPSSYANIRSCYNDCLNNPDPTNTKCNMIEDALDDRDDNGIFYLPTLVINNEAVRGALSCNGPLDTRSCQVLNEICQGYNTTYRSLVPVCVAKPTGCDFGIPKDCGGQCQTSAGTYINGVDACGLCLARTDRSWDKSCTDCNGQVNGNYTLDKCGICKAPNAERDNTCKDCNGVIWGNATKDCAGECGGQAAFDECGACIRFNQRSHWNQSCTDCLGVFRGSAKLDACNKCNGDGKSCASTTTVAGSTNWGAVIAIVLAVAGVVGVAIYLYMKRQQNRMREDIDGILKQYLPLQDGNTGSGHIRPTQRLPDHDNL